jgi:hypothetical protein
VRRKIYNTLALWLIHPQLPLYLAVLAMFLTLPALWVGWQMDDHYQRLMMTVSSPDIDISPSEIFSTLKGGPEVIHRYRDWGTLPWWTVDGFRLAFFRFLTILTHWLDYRLWPNSAALMHAHSLLWFGALIAAAASLYRRVMGPTWIAGLAALLYAVDDAHAFPASWLANRNALLATCFGLLCLVAHDQWRRNGSRRGAVLSPICLALGLFSGEAATATMGYLVAYALFLERGHLRKKVLAMVPTAVVLGFWALLYRLLGFGAVGSGMYIDPIGSPRAFAGAFLERTPFLLLGQWSPIPAEVGVFLSAETAGLYWWWAIVLMALIGLGLIPLLRQDRVARFWCLGMLLSLLPIAATFPSNRLLFFVGLGAMGLLAQFLGGLITRAEWLPPFAIWRVPARAAAFLFLLVHLILSPLAMPMNAYGLKPFGEQMVRAAASVPSDPEIAEQDLVLVNSPDYLFFVSNISTLKILEGQTFAPRMRALVTGPVPLQLTRENETTVRVRIEGGLFSGVLGGLFRSAEYPMAVGDTVQLTGFTAEVMGITSDGQPNEIVYRFSVPLEDPSLRWLRWKEGVYVPFEIPEVGESILLPPARGPFETWPRWNGN